MNIFQTEATSTVLVTLYLLWPIPIDLNQLNVEKEGITLNC